MALAAVPVGDVDGGSRDVSALVCVSCVAVVVVVVVVDVVVLVALALAVADVVAGDATTDKAEPFIAVSLDER